MSTRNSIILTRTKAAAAADGTSPPPPQGDGEAQEEETVHSQSKQEKEFKAAETSSVEKESNHTAAIQTSEKGEAVNSDTTSSDSDDDDFDIEKFYKSAFEDADSMCTKAVGCETFAQILICLSICILGCSTTNASARKTRG